MPTIPGIYETLDHTHMAEKKYYYYQYKRIKPMRCIILALGGSAALLSECCPLLSPPGFLCWSWWLGRLWAWFCWSGRGPLLPCIYIWSQCVLKPYFLGKIWTIAADTDPNWFGHDSLHQLHQPTGYSNFGLRWINHIRFVRSIVVSKRNSTTLFFWKHSPWNITSYCSIDLRLLT